MSATLEEEHVRVKQLRERMIDLSELRQNEIQALKQNIAENPVSIGGKIERHL